MVNDPKTRMEKLIWMIISGPKVIIAQKENRKGRTINRDRSFNDLKKIPVACKC
jgi:hypothetical protein